MLTAFMGIQRRQGIQQLSPLDLGNILLNVLSSYILTTNGYETIKVTIKNLKRIKILTLLAVLFLFSAPS